MSEEDIGRRFGVVVFDDPKDPGAGWSSVMGLKAERIAGPSELSSDTIWWTNILYDVFFQKTEAWRYPNLRHDKYLVIGHADVLREWGRDPAVLPVDFVCEFCSLAITRVMRLAWNLLREVNPKARINDAFTGKTLREDLRPLLPELEYPRGEAAISLRSGHAWDEFTVCATRSPRGSKRIVLRRPRLSYAMEILQTPVPRGPYEFVDRNDFRKLVSDGTTRVSYIAQTNSPMMLEVGVSKIEPDIAPIYGFGSSIDKNKRVTRSFVAHPEFLVLSRLAEVEVRTAWKGEEYWAMVPELPEAVKEFLQDKHTEVSWSAGVVAETLWRAVALSEDKSKSPGAPGDEKAMTSWQGAWFKSADKSLMFTSALRLAELGHAVQSYGFGWIRCNVVEEEMEAFIRDGLMLGLVPQILDVPDKMFGPNEQIPWEGDLRARTYAWLVLQKHHIMLWNLDQIPLLDKPKRKEAVKRIQAAMTARKAG